MSSNFDRMSSQTQRWPAYFHRPSQPSSMARLQLTFPRVFSRANYQNIDGIWLGNCEHFDQNCRHFSLNRVTVGWRCHDRRFSRKVIGLWWRCDQRTWESKLNEKKKQESLIIYDNFLDDWWWNFGEKKDLTTVASLANGFTCFHAKCSTLNMACSNTHAMTSTRCRSIKIQVSSCWSWLNLDHFPLTSSWPLPFDLLLTLLTSSWPLPFSPPLDHFSSHFFLTFLPLDPIFHPIAHKIPFPFQALIPITFRTFTSSEGSWASLSSTVTALTPVSHFRSTSSSSTNQLHSPTSKASIRNFIEV